MTWLSSVHLALRALRVHKLRSALTMLGIIIGVAAVIATFAIGAGAQAGVDRQLAALGSNLIVVNPGSLSTRGVRLGSGTQYTLTVDDAAAIKRELVRIEAAAPMWIQIVHIVSGASNWSTRLYGTTADYLTAVNWPLAAGRVFDAADLASGRKVVLLGDTVAHHLFGDGDPIGQIVRIGKVPMEVIGVLASKGQNHHGIDRDDMVVVPISTLHGRLVGGSFARRRVAHSLWIKVHDGEDMERAKADIRALLRERHRLPPERDDDFTLPNLYEVIAARQESARVMSLLLAAVGSIALLVGGIGIMNIMLVSVTERTREIGLRMAVGARGRDILSQFLIEALALALAGAACGMLLGIAGSYAIAHFAGWPTLLSPGAVLAAAASAGAIGLFFGFYPARKASRLPPIDALRYE